MSSQVCINVGRTRDHTSAGLEVNEHSVERANAGSRSRIHNEIGGADLHAGFGENIAVVRRHSADSFQLVHNVSRLAGKHALIRCGVAVVVSRAINNASRGISVREQSVRALKHAFASFGVRVVIGCSALLNAGIGNRVREISLRTF
jgi:hypothetical protein